MVTGVLLSSLVKVFREEIPESAPECCRLTALRGETVSFQVAFCSDEDIVCFASAESELEGVHIRSVEYVPVRFPGYPEHIRSGGYTIKNKTACYPDYLREISGGRLRLKKNRQRTVWVDLRTDESTPPGDHLIEVLLNAEDGTKLCRVQARVTVYKTVLPEATLIHTEWFHADCIADYYGYEVFSEQHWTVVGRFMKTAAERGQNMILTPIFTPPLDTAVGGERTTVQLVELRRDGGVWSFGYERLERWISLALASGMKYLEISHLFTQWGAKAAPKIMATVDGIYKRVFGWDTPVEEGAYPEFLREFLPSLTTELERLGVSECCYFHVSDEPSSEVIDDYVRARNIIKPFLSGYKIIDALSDFEFYRSGAVELPIPSSDHIMPFYEHNIAELWTYYCCGQGFGSNRFLAMSLARTRAIGVQFYKFNISGFLQWGYNFYNSANSRSHTDPYRHNDGSDPENGIGPAWPAGDPFVVYPGKNGMPEESVRLLAFYQAQTDLRALRALEAKTSREHVMELIEGGLDEPVTFENFPKSDLYYISLRNRVNKELAFL